VRELGDEAGEFARLVPEIRERFPHVPPAMDLPPEQGRRYLFDSFFRVLERVSKTVPILLFIDDLHLADSASLQLLDCVA
jgi:predicted ATPase